MVMIYLTYKYFDSLIGQLIKFFQLINQMLRSICNVKWTASYVPSKERYAICFAINSIF